MQQGVYAVQNPGLEFGKSSYFLIFYFRNDLILLYFFRCVFARKEKKSLDSIMYKIYKRDNLFIIRQFALLKIIINNNNEHPQSIQYIYFLKKKHKVTLIQYHHHPRILRLRLFTHDHLQEHTLCVFAVAIFIRVSWFFRKICFVV